MTDYVVAICLIVQVFVTLYVGWFILHRLGIIVDLLRKQNEKMKAL